MTIIAVDDEYLALQTLEDAIRDARPDAALFTFTSPDEALDYAKKMPVEAAFVDVEMPEMDGLVLAEKLREEYPGINIIFVTGHSDYALRSYDVQASGYVLKPINPERVLKELSNLRFQPMDNERPDSIGPYSINYRFHRVLADGRDALLTPKEYRLFCLFASKPGVFISPEQLYKMTWGSDSGGDVRAVYKHVSRLRGKLGMNEKSQYDIEAKRNYGYRLVMR